MDKLTEPGKNVASQDNGRVDGADEKITISINKKDVEIEVSCTTVSELVKIAGLGAEIEDYDLFCVSNNSNEPLDPDKPVQLKPGEHFRTIRKSNPYGS